MKKNVLVVCRGRSDNKAFLLYFFPEAFLLLGLIGWSLSCEMSCDHGLDILAIS